MEMKFDAFNFCVYSAIKMQKDMHDLRGVLLNDSELEVMALWKVSPQSLGSDVAVKQLIGSEATLALLEALSNTSGKGAIGRKRPIRFPGVVRVSDSMFQLVNSLCSNKQQLRETLKGLSKTQKKAFWSQFPTWTGIEVLREPMLLEWPSTLTFYWQVGSAIIKKTAADWRVLTKAVLDHSVRIPPKYRERIVELRVRELAWLEAADQELPIGNYRRLQPSIKSRVVYSNGASAIYNASLPFIYCASEAPLIIRPLRRLYDYLPPGHEKHTNDKRAKLATNPIVEGSNLYCYRTK
ncbi:hypothetical protein [Pseudomonas putida]|uniref:hypothetical protein n=1 Tax=Pseudomonas putida TaxID=303 RepID=UPI003D987ED0